MLVGIGSLVHETNAFQQASLSTKPSKPPLKPPSLSPIMLQFRQQLRYHVGYHSASQTQYPTNASSAIGWEESSNDNKNASRKSTPVHRMRRRKVKIYNQRKVRATAILFALWYILSVTYNIFNKKVLNLAPELAWTAAFLQISLGFLLYVFPVWASGLRAPPQVNSKDLRIRIFPVALLHALVHVGGVISMGAGAVSFTYIVKATEPAVSALLSAVFLKSFLPLPVYLTLIPVVAGVSLASTSEVNFTWKSFEYAMMSNVSSASRGLVSKKTMRNRVGKNLTASNLYAILTILATMVLFPVTAMLEGAQWIPSFQRLRQQQQVMSYAFPC